MGNDSDNGNNLKQESTKTQGVDKQEQHNLEPGNSGGNEDKQQHQTKRGKVAKISLFHL